jgi:apolipoprotein D and lipocalin family protein
MRTILLFIVLFFTGCSTRYAPLPTVTTVDLDRYLGTWHEIARYEHSFEVGCENVSATYSLREDGGIQVLNQCTKEGKQTKATGIAYATDASNSKLKVSFFRPFYGKYWIVMLDSDYTYAVIGEPSRKYFWILSRTKSLDEATKNEILSKMPELGYSQDTLIWTVQK